MDGNSPRIRAFAYLRRVSFAAIAIGLLAALTTLSVSPTRVSAQTAASPELLRLEGKISLGSVRGRIDHLAIDVQRQHLFVAELGNDSVGVVDLKDRKTIHTIVGLAEPQGVGYVPATDTVYVANARDGSVRLYRASDFTAAGRIELGDDADNIRIDASANRLFVGYGNGALAVVDTGKHTKVAEFPLPAHPEGFQLDREAARIFVNVPNAHAIAVLNAGTGAQSASWPLREAGNFPMTLDDSSGRVLVVSRHPSKLIVHDKSDGAVVANPETCRDADDLFVDGKRRRVYVSCGEGVLDVFDAASGYKRIGRISTAAGARTSLFVPSLDVLLLAVRATSKDPAAIWVYRPLP